MESKIEIISVFWIGTFVMLFLAFGLLFLAVFYQKRIANVKQKEAELLLKTALESEKKERQRIAKDLHDSVQGDLGAVRNYFTLLSKQITQKETQDLLTAIKEAIAQTIENARLISYNLMPPLLESSGLIVALREYLENLTKSTDKKFSLQTDVQNLVIPKAINYELFRIIQEFTSNMLKYGSITECKLFLYETHDLIHLEIVDDGKPFDFKASFSQSKGAGLYNIQSRLTSIEAKLVQRNVMEGNHFVISIHKKHD
ncbi:histidine kinase [uncultured Flavobacterium sp.]|uniref:sensor histidine kinase n=1 Tax=uncultured Flavobacterium sp. TaxID=165435 RepID=UPI0030C839E8